MNHIHVSAALSHLSQLAAREPAVASALEEAAAAAAAAAATVLNAPYTQHPPTWGTTSAVAQTPDAGASSVASTSTPQAPSGSPNSHGLSINTTAGGGATAEAAALVEALLRLLQQQLPHFTARQLANTAWALGKWPAGVPGRDEAIVEVVRAAAPQLPHFKPQELSNLLHGCAACAAACAEGAAAATAAACPPPYFLQEHARACAVLLRPGLGTAEASAGRFKMQELSNLLWAWGTLLGSSSDDRGTSSAAAGGGDHHRDSVVGWGVAAGSGRDAGVSGGNTGGARGDGSGSPQVQLPCRLVLSAQLAAGLGRAQPQELSNSVWGLARLQLLPPPEWWSAFLAAAHQQLDATAAARPGRGFSPQELSNLLWGCSKLRLRLPPHLLDAAGPALERCLPSMSLAERVNVLWALAWQAKLFGDEAAASAGPRGEGAAAVAGRDGREGEEGQGAEVEEDVEEEGAAAWLGVGGHGAGLGAAAGAALGGRRDEAPGVVAGLPERGTGAAASSKGGAQAGCPAAGPPPRQPPPAADAHGPHPASRSHDPGAAKRAPGTGCPASPTLGAGRAVLRSVVRSVLDSGAPAQPPQPPSASAPPGLAAPSYPASSCGSPRQRPVVKPQDVSMTFWSLATLSQAALAGSGPPGGVAPPTHLSLPHSGPRPLPHSTVCSSPAAAPAGAALPAADVGRSPWPPTPVPAPPPAPAPGAHDAGHSLLSPGDSDALLRMWGRCLPAMGPHAQATCVWAAVRLGLQLPPGLQHGLAAWMRRHAAALAPAEAAALLLGLGTLGPGLAPAAELVPASAAVLEVAVRNSAIGSAGAGGAGGYGGYCLWELSQLCYGAALLLRGMERWHMRQAADSAMAAAAAAGASGDGGAAAAVSIRPAAVDVRMSLDLEEDAAWYGPAAAAAAAAAANDTLPPALQRQRRRLAQPLERLLLQLQRGAAAAAPSEWGVEELAMTVAAVGLVVPAHVGEARGAELATWREDLVRTHVRRALLLMTPASVHVRHVAPLLHAVAAAAVAAVRAARQRRDSELARRRAAAAALSPAVPRSSVDEFLRSGRLADRREELRQQQLMQQHQEAQQRVQAGQEVLLRQQFLAPAYPSPAAPVRFPQPRSATWQASGLTVDCLQRLWDATGPSLHEASPREAAMMLWALAVLSVRPPAAWAAALLAAVRPWLRSLNHETLDLLLYSLGKMRLSPPADWMAAVLAEVEARAAAAAAAAAAAVADAEGGGSAATTAAGGGGVMGPSAVSGVLYGLSELEWPLPPEWLGRVVWDLAPQLLAMRPAQRTQAYAALASLDAALADRLGYEFCDLQDLLAAARRAGGRGGAAGGPGRLGGRWEGAGAEEGAGQQRALFSRSRGGWR